MTERMRPTRQPRFRAVATAGSVLVIALLACGPGELDFAGWDGDWDVGDASWFGPSECVRDEDCGPGRCCQHALLGGSCENLAPADPVHSFCSTVGGDQGFCLCHPPQPEPFCPGWLDAPPYSPNCEPFPYLTCAVFCDQRVCLCDTSAEDLGGVPIVACPPADWEKVCPGGADGGAG